MKINLKKYLEDRIASGDYGEWDDITKEQAQLFIDQLIADGHVLGPAETVEVPEDNLESWEEEFKQYLADTGFY